MESSDITTHPVKILEHMTVGMGAGVLANSIGNEPTAVMMAEAFFLYIAVALALQSFPVVFSKIRKQEPEEKPELRETSQDPQPNRAKNTWPPNRAS